ncbi:chlorite dismutase family protein [Pendulispora rubella]|uniref:Chlorite dismutase family protein n=1 Tax=Pendulispora rubella TaxID=2741070 RepID=A0ABZ2L0K1_9BACT
MSTTTQRPEGGTSESTEAKQPGLPKIDVNEYGGKKEGVRQSMNRRLFMQLLAFDVPVDVNANDVASELGKLLRSRNIPGVIYADTMSPRGLGLLSWGEDPSHFVRAVRPLFTEPFLRSVTLRQDMAMLGRSYSTGHEPDLEFVLLKRPIQNVLNESYPWHVWYPLRRTGEFARLEPIDQSHILREHASIGMAYGAQELAHDIRLACHGLDAQDNEFVIGLVGGELHPLSHLVQSMRKTRQTSEFIAKMGPFFVGYVLERSSG